MPDDEGNEERLAEVEVAVTPMRRVERDGVVVAATDRAMPTLTDEVVRATLERVRRWPR